METASICLLYVYADHSDQDVGSQQISLALQVNVLFMLLLSILARAAPSPNHLESDMFHSMITCMDSNNLLCHISPSVKFFIS